METKVIGKIEKKYYAELEALHNYLEKEPREKWFDTGIMSSIEVEEGIVYKKDVDSLFSNQNLVEREFSIMTELWETGFRSMPQPLDIFYDEDDLPVLAMEEITCGIPLLEIKIGLEKGLVSQGLVNTALDQKKEILKKLKAINFEHGDAHDQNFILGISKGQWFLYVIDFGWSFWSEKDDRDFL
jgi:RIO-like serine/threonine protein kinase